MRLEKSEKLLIEKLFEDSISKKKVPDTKTVELIKLTGDASTRRYYRLSGDKDSYVVCIDDPTILMSDTSNFIIMQEMFSNEGVRVPRILDSNPDAGYILEEDLGNQTLLMKMAQVSSAAEELKIYEAIVDQLISIHSIDVEKYKKSSFTKLYFNHEKLIQEVKFANKFFGHHFLQKDLNDIRLQKIEDCFSKICRKLAAQQMVVTHRDLHSRNVMVKGDDLIFIDFQDARMGIPQYDLVSLLEDSYYQLVSKTKRALIKRYWDNYQCPFGF